MALSETDVKSATPTLAPGETYTKGPRAGELRNEPADLFLWDDDVHGFGCRVKPDSTKTFFVQYRIGKQTRRLKIGQWPKWKVQAARERAKELLVQVDKRIDPAEEKRKALAASDKFSDVCKLYMDRIGRKLRDHVDVETAINLYLIPAFGRRPIGDIKRPEIIDLLARIAERKTTHPKTGKRIGGPVMARAVYAQLSRLFGFHTIGHETFISPLVPGMIKAAGAPSAEDIERDRALCARDERSDDRELIALWRATEEPTTYNAIVRACLLTAQRVDKEVAQMRRADIDAKGQWIIDADRYKMKRTQIVPLSPQALALINAQPVHRKNQELVFSNSGDVPFQSWSTAKRHLDERMLVELRKMAEARGDDPNKVKLEPWQLRDLRRTARTLMSRRKVKPHIAELALGHVMGGIWGTYDQWDYVDEKRAALAVLADEVDRIVA